MANDPGGGPVTETWVAPGPTSAILVAQNMLINPILAGSPVYRLPGNTITTAYAGVVGPVRRADGLAIQTSLPGTGIAYVYQGPLVLNDWTNIAGTQHLVQGATYYLDSLAGRITTTLPTRPNFALLQVIGVALDSVTLDVDPDTYEVDL